MNNQLDQAQSLGVMAMKQADAAQKIWQGFPPQTRIVVMFSVTFMLGALFYSIPFEHPLLQFSLTFIFTLAFTWFGYSIGGTSEVQMAMALGAFTGGSIWMYYFYNLYREQERNAEFGQLQLICQPKFGNTCSTDGTSGPYNGTTPYVFHTSKKTPDGDRIPNTSYVPASEFVMNDNFHFTYCFWLRVSYEDWASPKYFNKNKPVIQRTNGLSAEGMPGVWLAPADNVINFQVATNRIIQLKPVTGVASTRFPMDKWVHYGIVIRGGAANSSFELYKNGLLEKTITLDGSPLVKRSKLFIGSYYTRDGVLKEGALPGQLLYLLYYNKPLAPSDIATIYADQKIKIIELGAPPRNLQDVAGNVDESNEQCPDKCVPKGKLSTEQDKAEFNASLEADDGDIEANNKRLSVSFDSLFDKSLLEGSSSDKKKTVEGFDGSAQGFLHEL